MTAPQPTSNPANARDLRVLYNNLGDLATFFGKPAIIFPGGELSSLGAMLEEHRTSSPIRKVAVVTAMPGFDKYVQRDAGTAIADDGTLDAYEGIFHPQAEIKAGVSNADYKNMTFERGRQRWVPSFGDVYELIVTWP